MGYIRLVGRLIGLVLVQWMALMMGLMIIIALFPFRKARYANLARAMNLYGRMCCFVMNIHIQREGSVNKTGNGRLIVANHIGIVDIFVMAACFHPFFVSKSDIRGWPFIGQLTRVGGTIFIDRLRKTQVAAMIREVTNRLKDGHSVIVFPEGRATSGGRVEHFNSSAFEAVVRAEATVVPVMIRYYDAGDPSAAGWPDGVTFMESMMRLLKHPRMTAHVVILPEVTGITDRRAFAETSQKLIEQKFEETR